MFYVYILRSKRNKDIYIGRTGDLRKRFQQHNQGLVTATRPNIPWSLIYYEAYKHKKDTILRERQLKNHKAKKDLKIQLKYSLEIE